MSRPVVKRVRAFAELRDYAATINTATAGDARFSANALLFIAERLDEIAVLLKAEAKSRRPKRPRTKWQDFFAAGMKAGKSPAVIGEEWRARSGK